MEGSGVFVNPVTGNPSLVTLDADPKSRIAKIVHRRNFGSGPPVVFLLPGVVKACDLTEKVPVTGGSPYAVKRISVWPFRETWQMVTSYLGAVFGRDLLFAYIYEIDTAGHKGGPDSDDVQQALELVDGAIGSVLDGLEERNLTDIVNLIVLSDHGMAATSNDRLIYLDELLGDDFKSLEHRDGWPLAWRWNDYGWETAFATFHPSFHRSGKLQWKLFGLAVAHIVHLVEV